MLLFAFCMQILALETVLTQNTLCLPLTTSFWDFSLGVKHDMLKPPHFKCHDFVVCLVTSLIFPPGSYKEDSLTENGCLLEEGKTRVYNTLDQECGGINSSMLPPALQNSEHQITQRPEFLAVAGPAGVSMDGYSSHNVQQIVQHNYKKDMVVSNPLIDNAVKQAITDISQPVIQEVDNKAEEQSAFSAAAIPKYLDLEPSLAMDWLEISWEDLHLKERVGAGKCSSF